MGLPREFYIVITELKYQDFDDHVIRELEQAQRTNPLLGAMLTVERCPTRGSLYKVDDKLVGLEKGGKYFIDVVEG